MSYRYYEYSRRRVLRQRKRMLLLLHTSYATDDGGHAPEEQPPKRMNECRVRLWMKNNAASMKAAQNALWTKNANYDNERNFESNIIRYSTHFRLVWPFEQQKAHFLFWECCVCQRVIIFSQRSFSWAYQSSRFGHILHRASLNDLLLASQRRTGPPPSSSSHYRKATKSERIWFIAYDSHVHRDERWRWGPTYGKISRERLPESCWCWSSDKSCRPRCSSGFSSSSSTEGWWWRDTHRLTLFLKKGKKGRPWRN